MNRLIILLLSTLIITGCSSVTKQPQKSLTNGVHHIGLSVKDLKASSNFFIKALKFKKVAEKPDYPAIFVSDGTIMITLWQVTNKKTAVDFNRKKNVGLHHLALKLNSFEELDTMYEHLKNWPGVKFQFSPELMGKGPNKHMMLFEPSGIRIEFAASPK